MRVRTPYLVAILFLLMSSLGVQCMHKDDRPPPNPPNANQGCGGPGGAQADAQPGG
jgi:hypothetical protein